MFVARKSDHIAEDIKRNWSSWNFGQEGFEGTREELDAFLASATDSRPVFVSGFEIYPDDVKSFQFGELHTGYWVAIDNVNAKDGLSCLYLDADTLEEAIAESATKQYNGDGQCFDAREAKLVYSNNDIHIFEI